MFHVHVHGHLTAVPMSNNIYDEIGKASRKHNKAICRLIDHLTHFCGIDRFWRNEHHKDGSYSVLGNAPDVAEDFFGQELYLGHPYFRDPKFYTSGFHLPELFQSREFEETQGKLRKKGDCHHVLIYIHKKSDGFVEYGFATSEFRPGFETVYLNQMPSILKFIRYFEDESSKIILEAESSKVDIAAIIGEVYHQNPKIPSPLIVPEKELLFISAVEQSPDILTLTPSEKKVLHLYLDGKSTAEIAKTLFRSPRTIETHLERAKSKLGVRTRSELFELLLPFKEFINKQPS